MFRLIFILAAMIFCLPSHAAPKLEEKCVFFNLCYTITHQEILMDEALKWEGKTSTENRKELKEYINVDPVNVPWCAAFMNAVLVNKGYDTTNSLAARSFLKWGAPTKEPKIGDIVVLKRGKNTFAGHVGFFQGFEEVDGKKYVKVYGGNTDKAVTVGFYKIETVLGYRTVL